MKIAMTGVSGHMGREAFAQVMELNCVEWVRVLLTMKKRNDRLARRLIKKYGNRVQIVRGSLSDGTACAKLVADTDIVINIAAVIPPASDKNPKASYNANQVGTICLTDAVAAMERPAKFIHTSTVALYGNRTLEHPWARPGDPLLPSAFDYYAMHKLIAERYVMESNLANWAVLRQSAMLYDEIVFANISDGLMYHTTLNGPLEWVSARDSGRLIKRIIEREVLGKNGDFWNKVYDITGGAACRCTGYDTFANGFAVMGGSPQRFFTPNLCQTRNFHGVWYAEDELQRMFNYQQDTVADFWKGVARRHKILSLGRLVPSSLIRRFLFRRLANDKNAPARWVKDGDVPKVTAAYGSMEQAKSLTDKWEEFGVKRSEDYGANELCPKQAFADRMLSHGYDESKSEGDWELDDMKQAAEFRGGKCLSAQYEGPHSELLWKCSEGHTFTAKPYTVLKGGHWCPFCQPQPWIYDRLAKKSPYIAQVWYDSHSEEENNSYSFDDEGKACMEDDVR